MSRLSKAAIDQAQDQLRKHLPHGATINYLEIPLAKSAYPTVALLVPGAEGQVLNLSNLAVDACGLLGSRAMDALLCNPIWPKPGYLTAHIAKTLHGDPAALSTHIVLA